MKPARQKPILLPMLRRLYIENFILIRDLEIEFVKGLNVISGETGTGKSMTLSAVEFVMGRQGEYPEGSAVELELESGGETLLLRREIRNRRSRCFLNGRGTTAGTLREILEERISLQGQNEFLRLLRSDFQREVLDRFGKLEDLREKVEELYSSYVRKEEELKTLLLRREELERKRDFLEFRVKEVEEIALSPEEVEELKKRAETLENLERIEQHLRTVLEALYEGESSAHAGVSTALKHLWRIREMDPTVDPLIEQLTAVKEEIREIAEELRSRGVSLSEEEIDRVNETLYRIQRLERKYRKPYAEILREVKALREELERTEQLSGRVVELEEELKALRGRLTSACEQLSAGRRRCADALAREVESVLSELNLEDARFEVSLQRGELTRYGWDRVAFLFSAHHGDPRPVGETASGGELPRLFLALSLILPPAETYIFDEVDVGVSGETSVRLARLLRRLSRGMQVIAITHSAPVCAAGDLNLVTEKEFIGGIPYIQVRRLEGEERLREIARLMGATTENTIRGARELVELVAS